MESDEESIDSDEEVEQFKQEVYEAQKMVQEARVTSDKTIIERLNREPDSDSEDIDDPAPQGSLEIEVLGAAEEGRLEVIERLLKVDANLVGAQDRDGYTPLHRASYSNHSKIVEFLLNNGADVNAKTCDGWSPLHSACKWNNFNCAALLLDYGSEVNPLTNGGQTPLHLAASHAEAKETIYLLLSNPKISINIRNQQGETAYDVAHRHCKYYKLFEICEPCFNVI